MRYYLGTHSSEFHVKALLDTHVSNILITYADFKKSPDKAVALINRFKDANVIVDSGAFSVWNSGGSVDREKLIDFYVYIKENVSVKNVNFINLDEIPGKKGIKPTTEEAYNACVVSHENYVFFKNMGINVLPVFHEGDHFEFLEIYKKEADYIAISPANDSSAKRRMVWLDSVFSNLRAEYKTHGLAATSPKLLERYPFYSVDSINWKAVHLYGNSKSIDKKYARSLIRHPDTRDGMLQKEILYFLELEKDITNLWEKRGIKWE